MDELLMKYIVKFKDGFPMIPVAMGKTEEETMDIIKECIEKGKDAYELGYVPDDPY